MGKLIDEFYTLFPENHSRECYLFLDEVQNIPDWALVIRRFFDSKKIQIYLTGSSAKLLSKEISTSLRGRSLKLKFGHLVSLSICKCSQDDSPKLPLGRNR